MNQGDMVYTYLRQKYSCNEPIFLSDINIPTMSNIIILEKLEELMQRGQVRKIDEDIYYLPKPSIFRSGSVPSVDEIIRKKYLMDKGQVCGYISGIGFANQLGLTTQVPMGYELYTNKVASDYWEERVANIRVILKKPCINIDGQNVKILQLLDLLKEIFDISEVKESDLKEKLLRYMREQEIEFDSLCPYLPLYPKSICENIYKVGLLNGTPSTKIAK